MKKTKILIFIIVLLIGVNLLGYEIDLNGELLTFTGNPGELITSEFTIGLGRFVKADISGLQKGAELGQPELPHFTKMIALPNEGNWQVTKLTYNVKEVDIYYPVLPSGWEDIDTFDN